MGLRCIRRPGRPGWYIRGSLFGQKVFEATGLEDQRAAERRRIMLEQEITERHVSGKGPSITFREAVARYWEKGGRHHALGEFDEGTGRWTKLVGHFGERRVDEITDADLHDYARKHHKGCKKATINRHVIQPMMAVYNRNRIQHDFEKLKEDPVRTNYARPDYYEKALAAYADLPNLNAIILTMTFTGRRVTELTRVARRDVDWMRGELYLGLTKNGKERTVVLPDWLKEVCFALPEYQNGRLFGYTSRQGLYNVMKRRCKKAKIPYLPPHQIGRHTFAMWALKYQRMNLKEVQAAGGWESMNALQRYLHVTVEEAQAKASDMIENIPGVCQMRAKFTDVSKSGE